MLVDDLDGIDGRGRCIVFRVQSSFLLSTRYMRLICRPSRWALKQLDKLTLHVSDGWFKRSCWGINNPQCSHANSQRSITSYIHISLSREMFRLASNVYIFIIWLMPSAKLNGRAGCRPSPLAIYFKILVIYTLRVIMTYWRVCQNFRKCQGCDGRRSSRRIAVFFIPYRVCSACIGFGTGGALLSLIGASGLFKPSTEPTSQSISKGYYNEHICNEDGCCVL